ncbi:MAG TPA: glycosyltransferase [Candidatus Paceibacterota bacterium]|nr:glycosyltransferase [Candidatus Paceibacterota bacterium]
MSNNDLYYPNPRKDFLKTESPQSLFILNAVMAAVYFTVLLFLPPGNKFLFALLIAGEVFHVWQVLTFLYSVWETDYRPPSRRLGQDAPGVDVFITVAGEPIEIVEETVDAARKMYYPNFKVHILNDGKVANKENWRDIEALGARLGVNVITRTVAGGAKAGNINNGLRFTSNPLVAIFDADHVPHPHFLARTVPYFTDWKVGFVQTPQFYKNFATNYLTRSSWEQQELFFGPICKGKNRLNAATMCGTNMVINRHALLEVGGMNTESIAEDFITGLLMHNKGYRSVYVPEVLAEGLATEDLLSYSKQQFRWARGALDVIFRYNPLFMRGLTWAQRIQYLASASFFLSGAVVAIDALLPLIYFYTGEVPVHVSGMILAAVFLPYLFLTLYTIQRTCNFTFTFPSLGFSIGAFNIHLRALWAALSRQRSAFSITPKQAAKGNFLPLVKWHIAYIGAAVVGVPYSIWREGFSASLINNIAWALVVIVTFLPIIRTALPEDQKETRAARRPIPYTDPTLGPRSYAPAKNN